MEDELKRAVLLILKKLIRMLLLLLAVSAVTFALVSLSPIDPLQANVGQAALGTCLLYTSPSPRD